MNELSCYNLVWGNISDENQNQLINVDCLISALARSQSIFAGCSVQEFHSNYYFGDIPVLLYFYYLNPTKVGEVVKSFFCHVRKISYSTRSVAVFVASTVLVTENPPARLG